MHFFQALVLTSDFIPSLAVADSKEKEISRKERFAMKYMEAAASLSREDRLKYASEGTTYDTVVSMADLLLYLTIIKSHQCLHRQYMPYRDFLSCFCGLCM